MHIKSYFRTEFSELFLLFLSTVKWLVLACIAGVVAGSGAFLFLKILKLSTSWLEGLFPSFFLLAPLGLLLSKSLIHFFSPEAKGHGTERVIEAIHQRYGKIDFKVFPVKTLATLCTLSFGGSAGKEGPVAQIGASLVSVLGHLFRLSLQDLRRFVMCGLSAGFAAVFGTPVTGAIFGIEVLYVGQMEYGSLMSSTIASFISVYVVDALGVRQIYSPSLGGYSFGFRTAIWALIFGVIIAVVARLFINLTYWIERFGDLLNRKLAFWVPPIVGGLALIGAALLGYKEALGVGMEVVERVVEGEIFPGELWFVKILLVALTLGMGGSGGVVTPMFFIGSVLGMSFAKLFALDVAFWSQIGLAVFLGACANTPIAATIMAAELFGFDRAVVALLSVVVAYKLLGHRSIYPSQLLFISKSLSIDVPLGRTVGELQQKVISRSR